MALTLLLFLAALLLHLQLHACLILSPLVIGTLSHLLLLNCRLFLLSIDNLILFIAGSSAYHSVYFYNRHYDCA